jgi:hypothetical protein
MIRVGRSISKGAQLLALVMTPVFVFDGSASAQVSAGAVAAALTAAELPEVKLRADVTQSPATNVTSRHARFSNRKIAR